MAWWIWIILGAVLLAAEVVIAADFYIVFFGISALVLGVLGVAGLAIASWVQWLLFASLAIVGVVVYRSRFRKKFMTPDREMGPELVGESGRAIGTLAVGGRGKVELRGTVWEALNIGDSDVGEGGRCIVAEVDGLTLSVRPKS